MHEVHPYFIAILPVGELRSEILDRKCLLRTTVGEQLYLSDPPHLTVFLASFQDRNHLKESVLELASRIRPPSVVAEGWHVFEQDCLTGNHTLVIKLDECGKESLRAIQESVLGFLAKYRDAELSKQRYVASWARLSQQRQSAVDNFGFPFVGSDWHPHFTIASIKPDDWARSWNALGNRPIVGSYDRFELGLFEFNDGEPLLIASHPLSQ